MKTLSIRELRGPLLSEAKSIRADADYFQQDRLLTDLRELSGISYVKRDFLFRSGTWRGRKVKPPKPESCRRALVIGHSDISLDFGDAIRVWLEKRPTRVYATNFEPSLLWRTRKWSPLPLGLTNFTDESPNHRVFGDNSCFDAVELELKNSDVELRPYVNFTAGTYARERAKILELSSRSDWVQVGQFSATKRGRENYLNEMRECGLVICPRGNGHDTHRFYEALLVGALPVVLRGSFSARLASYLTLPHIAVKSWEEILYPSYLVSVAQKALSKSVSLEKIRYSFWLNLIVGS